MRNTTSLDLGSHETKHNLHSWMVSYADMITLLLCFFILFFKIEDTTKDTELSKKQLVALLGFIGGQDASDTTKNDKSTTASATGSAASTGAGSTVAHVQGSTTQSAKGSGIVNLDLDSNTYLASIFPAGLPSDLLATLGTKDSPAKLSNNQKELFIEFPKREFFAKDSDFLTEEGEDSVRKVIQVVGRYDKHIFIEIEGYADSSPVKRKDAKVVSNMNLSLKRAMRVYNFMIQNGVDKSALSVIGHGEHRQFDRSGNLIDDSALQFQRRVTFRIEARVK